MAPDVATLTVHVKKDTSTLEISLPCSVFEGNAVPDAVKWDVDGETLLLESVAGDTRTRSNVLKSRNYIRRLEDTIRLQIPRRQLDVASGTYLGIRCHGRIAIFKAINAEPSSPPLIEGTDAVEADATLRIRPGDKDGDLRLPKGVCDRLTTATESESAYVLGSLEHGFVVMSQQPSSMAEVGDATVTQHREGRTARLVRLGSGRRYYSGQADPLIRQAREVAHQLDRRINIRIPVVGTADGMVFVGPPNAHDVNDLRASAQELKETALQTTTSSANAHSAEDVAEPEQPRLASDVTGTSDGDAHESVAEIKRLKSEMDRIFAEFARREGDTIEPPALVGPDGDVKEPTVPLRNGRIAVCVRRYA